MNLFTTQSYLDYRVTRLAFGSQIVPYGISFLDDALGGITLTDLILIGARTGCGKTQLATQIALQASSHGKNTHFFALEADEFEIEQRLLYTATAKSFFELPAEQRPSIWLRYNDWRLGNFDTELATIEEAVHEKLKVQTANFNRIYRKASFTVDDFIKIFEGIRDETDLIIIDHLHYFDFVNESEMDGLKRTVRMIRDAALTYKKPVILLAQLRKTDRKLESPIPDIDDFYGHSDIVKIATNVILLGKAEEISTKSKNQATYAYIAKSRHCGDAQGYAGVLSYNLQTNSYEDSYYLSKVKRFKPPELIRTYVDRPKWAKRIKDTLVWEQQ